MSASRDPLDALKEIVALTLTRMTSGVEISSGEAYTLGQISGVACRVPGAWDPEQFLKLELQ